jgi:hypothetical protein
MINTVTRIGINYINQCQLLSCMMFVLILIVSKRIIQPTHANEFLIHKFHNAQR